VTIDILPDDVLLQIFRFYQVVGPEVPSYQAQKWRTLVHVCRRWRSIIFASPRHLDLRLVCTAKTQVKEMLDIWPILPIEVWGFGYALGASREEGADNIIAALKHNDRVWKIELECFRGSLLERIAMMTKGPFPALTHLRLAAWDEMPPVIPEAFLGGSAPHLRSCSLQGVTFPGIWRLLLTANHLAILLLWRIPHSTLISPEAMVMCLSTMPNLEQLWLQLQSPSRPDQASRRPPLMPVVLPAVTRLRFHGDSEYLEDLCSRIDTPLLDDFQFTLFNVPSDTPQIQHFINRTEMSKTPNQRPLEYFSWSGTFT